LNNPTNVLSFSLLFLFRSTNEGYNGLIYARFINFHILIEPKDERGTILHYKGDSGQSKGVIVQVIELGTFRAFDEQELVFPLVSVSLGC
jgi:hypothetical protein